MTRNYFYDDNIIKMCISWISEEINFIKQPYSWDLQVEVKNHLHICLKWGFSNWILSSIIEIISRKPLKKYGLSLSCWNIPTIIYQNLENDIFILIGRNTSLLNQWLNSHYLQVPPTSKWRMDFLLLLLDSFCTKSNTYSCIGLCFNSPLFK